MNYICKMISLVAISQVVVAGDGHDHHHNEHKHADHAQHEAHVHGTSELMIAVEGSSLELAFEAPANDVVGFEYKAKTQAEKQRVLTAKKVLAQHASVFELNGGDCTLNRSEIDVSSVLDEDDSNQHDGHHHHSRDQHDDKHHAKHEHHDKKTHAHDKHEKKRNENTHSEITAHYHYKCKKPAALSSITVGLFKLFPSVNTINTEWVKQSTQGASVLNAKRNAIAFKKR